MSAFPRLAACGRSQGHFFPLGKDADRSTQDLGAAHDSGLSLDGAEQREVILGEADRRLVGFRPRFHRAAVSGGFRSPLVIRSVDVQLETIEQTTVFIEFISSFE